MKLEELKVGMPCPAKSGEARRPAQVKVHAEKWANQLKIDFQISNSEYLINQLTR